MNIESQLVDTLTERIREKDTKHRNIELIACYFGFRGHPCPNYGQLGQLYGAGTRERVRQIIKTDFRSVATAPDFPALQDCYKVLKTQECWTISGLDERILKSGLAGDNFHVEGILRLMRDLGLDIEYGMYTPDLEEQPKRNGPAKSERFVIERPMVEKLRPWLQRARKLTGRYGIARLDYLDDGTHAFADYQPLLHTLITYSEESWTYSDSEPLWYMFEDVENNPLVNMSKKVFAVVKGCDAGRLAITFHNALQARSHQHEYPSVAILASYFRSSKRFERLGERVTYNGMRNRSVTAIEMDLVEFLGRQGESGFSDLKEYLEGRGHSYSRTLKAVMSSPFVYIDRSGGRSRYLYSLVEPIDESLAPDVRSRTRRQLIA